MPGDSGVTWLQWVLSTTTSAHAATGRIGRPAFPAPSEFGGRDIDSKTRADCAARMRSCDWNRDVDANTHPSCPGLTRASINLRKSIFRRRWIFRARPRSTEGVGGARGGGGERERANVRGGGALPASPSLSRVPLTRSQDARDLSPQAGRGKKT